MWKFIGGIIAGPFVKIFSTVLDYRNVKAMIEAGVVKQVIQSDIEINRLKLQVAAVNQQWWVTRWIMPAFAYPVAIHFGAVVLVSVVPNTGLVINALPHPLDQWEGEIILSFFIVGSAERIVAQWLNRGIIQSLVTNLGSQFNPK